MQPCARSLLVGRPSSLLAGALIVLVASFGIEASADTGRAAHYSARHRERALLIWQKVRIRLERYATGGAPDKAENIYSITKSVCALATFSAIGRSILQLDKPVSWTLTEWRNDPQKRKIRVRDLLNQTSGLSPGFAELCAGNIRNKEKVALRLPVNFAPGKKFAYGPSHYEALEVLCGAKAPAFAAPLDRRSSAESFGHQTWPMAAGPDGKSLFFRGRPAFGSRSGRRSGNPWARLEPALLSRSHLAYSQHPSDLPRTRCMVLVFG